MRRLLSLPATLVLLLFIPQLSAAAPLLNGLALHQELGNEQFIGAIYAEQLTTDAGTLVSSRGEKRMELKILAENGITTRRFSRMWIEGMAINNPNALLTAQADNMVKFTNFFRGRLETGDHVVLHLLPDEGINVEVNGNLLGTINDPDFFPLLLRTWVGQVPLSSTYRDNVLQGGNVSPDLRFRFSDLQPSEQRIEAVAGWGRPVREVDEPVREVAAAPRPTPTPPAVVTPPPLTPGATQEQPTEPEPEPQPVAAAPTPPPPPPPPPPEDDDDDMQELTAESLLAQQFYHSSLLRAVNSNISYPRRALMRRQEGGLRIGVVINRQGKVLSMEWLEESPHDMLNREAWSAIQRADPFPAVPDSIRGEEYEFSVPINFRVPDA